MTDSIGQQLRQAREARSLTLEDAARATHIRVYYLKAFEAGEFEILPSLAQGKGFLRAYAGFLGIDPQPLIVDLENEIGNPTSQPGAAAEAGPEAQMARPPAQPVSLPAPSRANRSVTSSQPDTRAAQAIFIEIGGRLRHQRELLGLSLEDVERHTHLRTHYLTTLEAGKLQGLPSPVQGRGMLHNYAIFLGLDPEPLMLRFAEGLQALLAARQAAEKKTTQPRKSSRQTGRAPGAAGGGPVGTDGAASAAGSIPAPTHATPGQLTLRRFFSLDILFGAAIVIFLAAFMIWGGVRILDLRSSSVSQTSTPTAPSIADVLSTNSAVTPTAPALELTEPVSDTLLGPVQTLPLPTLAPGQELTSTVQINSPLAGSPTLAESGPIQVNLAIRQRTWMRVLVDGKVEFEGIALPGSAYPFSGDNSVEVLTGNGAAIQVIFNQADLGVLGSYGAVVDDIYTLKGIQTPTPSITPTQRRTATPPPGSETPPATITVQPTATPTIKPTNRPPATPTP
jgi:cytoskeleton protein RodZ